MKKYRLLVITLLLLVAAAQSAQREALPFAHARELILTHNAGLKSTASDADAAKAGVARAGAFPNPEFSVALERFGANEVEATVGQTFELGGKRLLRTEAAQKEYDATVNARAISLLELEAEMVRRFIPIAAVGKKIVLLDSMVEEANAARKQIQLRVEAGAIKRTDLVRAEIEIEQLGLERSGLVREEERARLHFAALGGDSDSSLLQVSGSVVDDIKIPPVDEWLSALSTNPAVKAADIEREKFETQKKLLDAEVVPDLTASAGYLRNNADKFNAPLVGFSMNIPLFNKNSAAKQQVGLLQLAADERRQNAQRLLVADVRILYSRLMEIDNQLHVLQLSTIPKAGQVYAMMEEYYNAGNAGFLDLSTARSEMLRLRMAILDIRNERARALADLVQTTSLSIQIVH